MKKELNEKEKKLIKKLKKFFLKELHKEKQEKSKKIFMKKN